VPVASPSDRIRLALTPIRDALAGAGVPASLDPASVQLPGAWITARSIDQMTMRGGGRLTYHLYLIAPAVPTLQALDILNGLYDAALPVIDPVTEEGDIVDLAQSVLLPSNPGTALPAFRLVGETSI
jgi:hypothetical protein